MSPRELDSEASATASLGGGEEAKPPEASSKSPVARGRDAAVQTEVPGDAGRAGLSGLGPSSYLPLGAESQGSAALVEPYFRGRGQEVDQQDLHQQFPHERNFSNFPGACALEAKAGQLILKVHQQASLIESQ